MLQTAPPRKFFSLISLLSCVVTTTNTCIPYRFYSAISDKNAFKHPNRSHTSDTCKSSSANHTRTVTILAWWLK
ncbi:hypothetical protein DAPPUDRAFT_249430 [Daphnia pulex]|uniref:Secreted protein n=1 Tax=Daphnia pulex TaxID=6669 RepID=E9GWN1_DAPPU|nr:hypothetical protein DAPPUDRAFT_249430 [Daphnia pulex]|eukprot:EFX76151.1 hypothetical protein DAPPUDRAFT_249430 [Daphnia pulex]